MRPFLQAFLQNEKIIRLNDPKVGGMSTIVQPRWQNLINLFNCYEPK